MNLKKVISKIWQILTISVDLIIATFRNMRRNELERYLGVIKNGQAELIFNSISSEIGLQ